jgi:hypothetical protein
MMPRPQHPGGDPVDAPSCSSATEIADNRDRDADRVGDLSSDLVNLRLGVEDPVEDPSDGEEEVWFEAEALAAASRVELGSAAGGGPSAPGPADALEQLRALMASPGISLAELPSWPTEEPLDPDIGPALGPALAELLGELRAGDVILFGGRGRGVGRTSLLAQLGDALALRSEAPRSPVVCVVEGPPVHWRARSVARWSGLDVRRFLEAGAAEAAVQMQAFCASDWIQLDRQQRFIDAARLRSGAIAAWRTELTATHGREVWPILLIDPLEQLLADGEELLADLERLAHEQGLIVLASCDEPEPADARRLDRHARARLRVSGSSKALDLELCHRRLGPTGSVRLRWDRASGRIGAPRRS